MSNKKPFIHTFNSWHDFVYYAENTKTDMPEDERSSRNGDISFTHTKSFKDAINLANVGWEDGAKEMQTILNPIFNNVSKMIERLEVNHDTEGHSIDVARFIEGEPESWMKFEDVLKESENGHKLIRITFNMCVSAAISTKTIMKRGASISALIELLEYSGHRVELILCDANSRLSNWGGSTEYLKGENTNYQNYITIKSFDQNLDPSIVSMALAHPSTFRRFEFSVMECLSKELRQEIGVGAGYGNVSDIPKDMRGDIHFGPAMMGERQWDSEEETEKWIIDQLKLQGVVVNVNLKEKTNG